MLRMLVSNVDKINDSMNEVKVAASEINKAMESSSIDAQHLSEMTQNIHNDAMKSVDYAKNISKIDDQLSTISSNLFEGLTDGKHAVSNEELLNVIKKAVKAHKEWIMKMNTIVEKMELLPIQTNSNKCAFGHFYHAIHITKPELVKVWTEIDKLHHAFHSKGDEILNFVKADNSIKAKEELAQATSISKEMLVKLAEVENIITSLNEQGVKVYKSSLWVEDPKKEYGYPFKR